MRAPVSSLFFVRLSASLLPNVELLCVFRRCLGYAGPLARSTYYPCREHHLEHLMQHAPELSGMWCPPLTSRAPSLKTVSSITRLRNGRGDLQTHHDFAFLRNALRCSLNQHFACCAFTPPPSAA